MDETMTPIPETDTTESDEPVASIDEAAADEPTPKATTEAPAESLVSVRGLFKHYGAIKAVDGLEFEVGRGEILGFMGPNGAGKTTAMRLITGFLEPDSGEVTVCGFNLADQSLEARERIGYLPENAPAYGEMTVVDFLRFVGEARAVEGLDTAVEQVLGLTELHDVRHQTIETLSKGYKRRVGLAQALIHDPEVLILDEPTDGLDPNQKQVVRELISRLSAGKCIIVSTHILDEVEKVCNRAMILHQGRIVVDSTPAELIAQAPDGGDLEDLFRHLTRDARGGA